MSENLVDDFLTHTVYAGHLKILEFLENNFTAF